MIPFLRRFRSTRHPRQRSAREARDHRAIENLEQREMLTVVFDGNIEPIDPPGVAPFGLTVEVTDGGTEVDESGTTDTFDVALNAQPDSNIIVSVDIRDTDEATVDVNTLTFTPENWDTPQTVTVTGVDDDLWDDDSFSQVTLVIDREQSDPAWGHASDEYVEAVTTDDELGSLDPLDQSLVRQATSRWHHVFGNETYSCGELDGPFWHYGRYFKHIDDPTAFVDGLADGNGVLRLNAESLQGAFAQHATAESAATPGVVSDTNVQVAGVDEADIVETDGRYIYSISGNQLIITETGDDGALTVVSRTEVADAHYGVQIYLTGDRLTVVSSQYGYGIGRPAIEPLPFLAIDIAFAPPVDPQVAVTVLDVSDRHAPEIQTQTFIDGHYIDSRMVDGQLSLVVQNHLQVPSPEPLCEPIDGINTPQPDDGSIRIRLGGQVWIARPDGNGGYILEPDDGPGLPQPTHRFESADEYRQRIAPIIRSLFEQTLPGVHGRTNTGETERIESLISIDDVTVDEYGYLGSVLTVALVDTESPLPGIVDSASLSTSSGSTVYADADSVYVVGYGRSGDTEIHKFDVLAGDVEYAASGRVDGYILNQFSIDEHNGHLRIATSTGWGTNRESHVFVLEQQGDELQTVGHVGGIAPGETLFAARFMGDRGFLVTFLVIDPLFTLDLSDPTNPQVVGELKIPGFSRYLQPVSDTHLIGIGRDGNRHLQVSLFDVTDPTNPVRVDQFSFAGDAWSDIEYEHQAVNYFPSDSVLALPFTSGGWWWIDPLDDGLRPDTPNEPRSGIQLLRIDLSTGFEDIGIAPIRSAQRTVRIDDVLFAISTEEISSSDINDPGTQLDRIVFGEVTVPATDYATLVADYIARHQGNRIVEAAEFDPATGTLTLGLETGEHAQIGTNETGDVVVNGVPVSVDDGSGTAGPLAAVDVQLLIINGNDGSQLIDLSQATAAAFTGLSSLFVSTGSSESSDADVVVGPGDVSATIVTGSAQDTVELSDDWSFSGMEDVNDPNIPFDMVRVYTSGNATVRVAGPGRVIVGSLDDLAGDVDDVLGLRSTGNLHENWAGRGEKWLRGHDGWYYVLPSGDLHRWNRSRRLNGQRIASFAAVFHKHVELLTRARGLQLDRELGLHIAGGRLHTNWGGQSEHWLRGDDGEWYFIKPDGAFYRWDGQGRGATGEHVANLDAEFYDAPDMLADAGAVVVDQLLDLTPTSNLWEDWLGLGEKWLRSRDADWYVMMPTGEIHEWHGRAEGVGDRIAAVDAVYHRNPSRLINALDSVFDRWRMPSI